MENYDIINHGDSMKKEIVVVGMSGGVDSSVAACLLKEEGYQVIGATMKLLEDEKTKDAIEDAKKICTILNIPHYIFDLTKEFKNLVIENFITSYKKGLTPNPCIVCNKYFKFGLFFKKAQELGATYIATGHYAKVKNNRLIMSNAKEKDQSYFLCQIDKTILPNVIFPLNKFHSKEEIRTLAKKYNLPVSEKKDSQEICFIPNDDYKSFLEKNNMTNKSGNIILKDGTILGKHNGLYKYTIGQRKGLNIAYKEPLYVLELDTENNNVIIGTNNDLLKKELVATNINYLIDKDEFFKTKLYAKIRSRGALEEIDSCQLDNEKNLIITFVKEQRAITPGQYIVFYNDRNECLGSGCIEK